MKTQLLATFFALGLMAHSTTATAQSSGSSGAASLLQKIASYAGGAIPQECQDLAAAPSLDQLQSCASRLAVTQPRAVSTACNAICNRVTCKISSLQQACETICCAAAGPNATYSAAKIGNCMGNPRGTCPASVA